MGNELASTNLLNVAALQGGQQNQNFLVTASTSINDLDDVQKYVVRLPGVDAAEHGQTQQIVFTNSVAAHEILKVAPKSCSFDPPTGIIVTKYLENAENLSLKMLSEDPAIMEEVVRTIRTFHDLSDAKTFVSSKASDVIGGYSLVNFAVGLWEEGGGEGGSGDNGILVKATQLQTLLKNTISLFDPLVACHNDLCMGNFLIQKNQQENEENSSCSSNISVKIIDWEWAGPGDRFCDVGIFCSFCSLTEQEEYTVLYKYLNREPTELELARTGLWKCWFALRGAMWARQKATSSHFHHEQIEMNDDNNYNLFANNDYEHFKEMLNSERTEKYISVVQNALKL
jgi:hypothetical protein